MVTIKRTLAAVAPLLFTLMAVASPAGTGNEGNRRIQLSETVVLSGVAIQPGSYMLSWSRERGSDDVRIAIARGKNVLATATGRWVESAQPSPYEGLVYQTASGANDLTGILFQRSADSIRIDAGTTRADAGQPKAGATN